MYLLRTDYCVDLIPNPRSLIPYEVRGTQ
jgi:hypothetical protein